MRSTRTYTLITAPLISAALLGLAGCGFVDEPHGKPAAKPAPASSVKFADAPLGRILVDETGRTLYGFTKDKPGTNGSCDSACIAVWPALTTAGEVTAGEGVDPALLEKTKLSEGAEQATYGGWPLYYYVGDAAGGDVNGQGLDNEWFVIGVNGKLIKKAP
ncbi:hypothetical protein ACFUJR_36160 [Streptomyces sp. NPDC057271]|uniref:COG4315 family predicted lipoprotein n=1 Tax=unclassified Streptomyces TaxID=2593676 RepID=UPI0036267158